MGGSAVNYSQWEFKLSIFVSGGSHVRFARVENNAVSALLLKSAGLMEAAGFQPRRLREQGSLPATPRALSEPGRPSKASTSRQCDSVDGLAVSGSGIGIMLV